MSARGADLLVDALAMAGVRHLFSLSGNQILSVYDATVGRDITLIHTRHEAAAVHMAEDMTLALSLAAAWAPGPVHLDLPGDLLEARVTSASPAPAPSAEPRPMDDVLIRRTLDLLGQARRPLIIAGAAMGRSARWND